MKIFRYKRTIIGGLFIGFLLLSSFLYDVFGPENYNQDFYHYDQSGELLGRAPFPPSFDHLLGTDRNGRDILYMMIDGGKFTLLVALGVTALRVLLGGVVGVIATLWAPWLQTIMKDFFFVFRFVPTLLLTYILMIPVAIRYTGLPFNVILPYQIVVLFIIGFPPVMYMTSGILEELKEKSFVQSSFLMGASKLHVLKVHLMPFLKSYGLLMFVQQLLQTLVTIMHLGIFELYIGGPTSGGIFGDEKPPKMDSLSKEWAGLIGQNYREFFSTPWIVLGPLIGFFILIILVNMMKKELESSIYGLHVKKVKQGKRSKPSTMEQTFSPSHFVLHEINKEQG